MGSRQPSTLHDLRPWFASARSPLVQSASASPYLSRAPAPKMARGTGPPLLLSAKIPATLASSTRTQ
ncbi:hypothetical protein BC834DRAFT_871687 [Gloeopeniophorella convolvens]|nr:hypothetical protein BC834DRAFT_871687 [Gloeopeniophorella convolvens]